jgi:Neutral/alkaline non-lysosomal ceramidase, N-terminal
MEVDITPSIGLPMDGYLARTGVSSGVHDPLMAQVLVLDDGLTRAVIVTLDALAVSGAVTARLRRSLSTALGATTDAIMICASHTHAGPSGLQDWFPIGVSSGLNDELIDLIDVRLTRAAREARDRLAPARLAFAAGEVDGIGTDRNHGGPAPDPLVTVLSFEKPDSVPIAIIFHYACHPTVLGPQLDYSTDFPGAARRHVQASFPGAVCLYLNGAAGNISTRFTRRDQTFGEVERLGVVLAERVLALLDHSERATPALSLDSRLVDLPVRAFTAQPTSLGQTSEHPRIEQTRAEGRAIEARLRENLRDHRSVQATLSALRIGPWALFGVPGEPFNELAADLHRVSPQALVLGYANDYLGYFPTEQAISDRTYEALSSPYDARALDMIRHALVSML